MKQRTYIAIDLKSFYASVEFRARNLNPMTTNLVVADPSRTEKTICLAVSPSLEQYGKVEMEDDALNDLDEKFQVLMDHLKEKPEIKITYFKADERKAGGAYFQVSGAVRKISEFERKLVLDDGIEIKLDDIVDLEGDIFKVSLRRP